MHGIIDKKFYLGPKFGTLFNKKWITISELLHPRGHLHHQVVWWPLAPLRLSLGLRLVSGKIGGSAFVSFNSENN
jgi:hypothetical protein